VDGDPDHPIQKLFPSTPPPGPFRPHFWSSPLRGPWLTALLGSLLLILVTIVAVTGILSQIAYNPTLGHNAIVDPSRDLLPWHFSWPTHPSWLYALTQGLHVTVGIVAIPLLLAKLWSVIPKLFTWVPVKTPAMAIERLAIGLLVGSALFEFATGVVNAQIYYPFKFNFVVAHYYGAVVFVASLVLHVLVKSPVVLKAYRERGVLKPLRESLEQTRPEPMDDTGLVAAEPAEPTLTRRGLLGVVGAGSATLLVVTAGQSIGGPLRELAVLAPRGRGGNRFPVNKTAAAAGIKPATTGSSWRLQVAGPQGFELTRGALLAMPQTEASLPIACVEGWSTTQHWSGVRLRDLAAMAGGTDHELLVESLQKRGVLRQATLSAGQVSDDRSLLALKVNGADLSIDHGFPARIIVPALPGVHNTKWVSKLTFRA